MKSVFGRSRCWRTLGSGMVVAALVVAGCVGATPSGSASPRPPAGPTETAADPGASPIATLSSPTTTMDPLQNVPAAPSGTWTAIRWTALPSTPAFGVRVATASIDPNSGDAGPTFQVFGWSRGYVGFTITPSLPTVSTDPKTGQLLYSEPTIVSSYSRDGVHWIEGQKLDTTAAGSQQLQVIRSVIEGPAGLLAVGWSSSCASEYLDSLWTSSDGITWKPVNVGKVFGAAAFGITHVSGGAAGYVAVAYKSGGVWTSKDGRSWRAVALSTGPFKDSLVNDGAATSDGYILAGTAGTRDCGATTTEGSPPPPVFRTAAAWWSADSSSWTRVTLPGAVASSEYQDTWVFPLNERSVVIVNDIWGDSGLSQRSAWASTDGRNWTSVGLPVDIGMRDILSNGQHNLVVEGAQGADATGYMGEVPGELRLRTIDDGFAVSSIDQSGDVPQLLYLNGGMGTYGMVALGPTGVVVTNADGTQIWFGTPSAK